MPTTARKTVVRKPPAGKKTASVSKASKARPVDVQPPEPASHLALWSSPGFLARRLAQIHYAIFFHECQDFNVTPVQYGVMVVLRSSPGLDQSSLSAELGLDRTSVAEVLGRLAARGLLERVPSPTDRRQKLASLTPEGEALTDRIWEYSLRCGSRLLSPLSKPEARQFMKTLVKLVEMNNHFGRSVMNPNFDRLSVRFDEG